MHRRPFSRTSATAFVRFTRRLSASTKFRQLCLTPTRTLMPCLPRWEPSRKPLMQPMPGIWTRNLSRPWMRCDAHPQMPPSRTSPVERSAGLRCASCCWRSLICCFSMSPPTTWMPRAFCGWSSTFLSTQALLLPSHTTVTSSTTLLSGLLRSTAVASTLTRATTPPTSRRRRNALRSRERKIRS